MRRKTILIIGSLGVVIIAGAITALFLTATHRQDAQVGQAATAAKRPTIVQQNGLTMTIASPTDHQQLDMTVPIRLTITGDISKVHQVDYQIDGKTVSTATKAPFTIDLPVTTLTAGTHTVTMIVRDSQGNLLLSHQVMITIRHAAATSPASPKATTAAPTTSLAPVATPTAPLDPLGTLPRIAWEGGPAYWNQFAITKAAGWTNPNFFPMVMWFNGISSNDEAQFDKSFGINSYIGMDSGTPYSLFADNSVYWLGGQLNATFPSSGTAWAGDFLDDELDGTAPSLADAVSTQQSEVASSGNDGRFKEYNFSQIVIGDYGASNNSYSGQLVNDYAGPVSADAYWYTVPNCTGSFAYLSVPVDMGHCQTSSSYGATIRALRGRDALDGSLKPLWQFVEDLNGGPPGASTYSYITPDQLKGAVMDSIINEARGILYFNQSFTGPCQAGSILRQYQVQGSGFCAAGQMDALRQVSLQVQSLAPVLNTQSYAYSFGGNLDTMLKWYNGSAYIFAMISGDASSQPGDRSFTLPTGLAGASSVMVLNEGRTIPISGGVFHDTFGAESTYHVYQLTP